MPNGTIEKGTVLCSGGKIEEVCKGNLDVPEAVELDAKGNYISPGFIDIHVHGGGGYDFMDGSVSAFLNIAKTHARYGTTSMVPTTLSSSKESILQMLSIYSKAQDKNVAGAEFLGVHLEGPYFAMNQRGAQDPRYIRNPQPQEYEDILSQTQLIKRWSAAPELQGGKEFGRYIKSKGVLPAIAHSDAIYEEVVQAFENGYSLITHLYSGMSGVTRRNGFRYAGVIESAYLIDDLDVEVIADGVHLPTPLLKLAYKIKGAERISLITDSMRAAGTRQKESILGARNNGLKVIVEDGVAKLPDRSAFAGSVTTTNQLVRNMVVLAGVPLVDAVKMITTTPARIMQVNQFKGALKKGFDADIVVFDKNVNIQSTIVRGKLVYSHEPKKE
jgi:N-acetylglucosamine-6-phosphate deacetylase